MPLPIPNLDDKTFEALVSEARKLIALHAPEWTDHNLSDPGITMVELFAWLTEMQLYCLNRIGDQHFLKYLKLLGTSPQPARPAKVDVTFTGRGSIQAGSRVAATDPQTGENIVFESDEDLELTETELKKIEVYSNYQPNDITGFNQPNKNFFYAFGPEAKPGNAFYLDFTEPPPDTLCIHFYLYDNDLPRPGRHDGDELFYSYDLEEDCCRVTNGDETIRLYPSAKTRWQYGESDQVVPVLRDETAFFTKSGIVTLQIKTPPGLQGENRLRLKCEITEGSFEIPPRIERILLHTVAAVQGEKLPEKDKLQRISSGLPGQTFETGYRPVIQGSESVLVNGQPWEHREDLDASGPGETHYKIDWTKGLISFGDGINGMIPPKGETISIVFRYGGGERGNVMPLAVTRLIDQAAPGIEVRNYFPGAGGRGPETVEDAYIRVKKALKTPQSAVTLRDYESIAVATPGLRVARAGAFLSNGGNGVTVVVVPYSLPGPPQKPSEGFQKTVCHHLDSHRLITTDLEVIGPDYVGVSVSGSVKIRGGADAASVQELCLQALKQFLSPLKRSADETEWPFGRPVYQSEIYEVLEDVPGVDGVTHLSLRAADTKGFLGYHHGNILIDRTALVYSGEHVIEILPPQAECTGRMDE